jgi:hypothetical protein
MISNDRCGRIATTRYPGVEELSTQEEERTDIEAIEESPEVNDVRDGLNAPASKYDGCYETAVALAQSMAVSNAGHGTEPVPAQEGAGEDRRLPPGGDCAAPRRRGRAGDLKHPLRGVQLGVAALACAAGSHSVDE